MPEDKGSSDDVMKSKNEDMKKDASPLDAISDASKDYADIKKAREEKEDKSKFEPLENFKVKTLHTVAAGENLSTISEKYYKTGVNWVYIYRANMDVIGDDPDIIQAGTELKIPAL